MKALVSGPSVIDAVQFWGIRGAMQAHTLDCAMARSSSEMFFSCSSFPEDDQPSSRRPGDPSEAPLAVAGSKAFDLAESGVAVAMAALPPVLFFVVARLTTGGPLARTGGKRGFWETIKDFLPRPASRL